MCRLASTQRGVSRNELLMALAFSTLALCALVFFARPGHASSAEALGQRVAELASAAKDWRAQNDSGCPTVGRLVADGFLRERAAGEDPWGGVFRFDCDDDRIDILSDGEDRSLGTSDDQRFTVE